MEEKGEGGGGRTDQKRRGIEQKVDQRNWKRMMGRRRKDWKRMIGREEGGEERSEERRV